MKREATRRDTLLRIGLVNIFPSEPSEYYLPLESKPRLAFRPIAF